MVAASPTVLIVNESTVLSDVSAWNIAWALNYQAQFQFGPAWGIDARVAYLPAGAKIPAGAWVLHLLDECDVQGALGYHDEDGKRVPFGRVGVKTSTENGVVPSEVASHELLELLVDPHVNLTAWDPHSRRLYAYEVGDACQQTGYDVGAPEGRHTGVTVANFVLPGWFDPNTPSTVRSDYRNTLHGPFALGAGGYVSYTQKLPPDWQQQLGEKANPAIVDHDDRVKRRATLA